jgi:L-asparaginase/Glu-tRNA(Gln) amidotransferase subunit D
VGWDYHNEDRGRCPPARPAKRDRRAGLDLDSADATVKDWYSLDRAVRAASLVGPVLVTHGTDTLTWSATYAAAGAPLASPVVFTGANVPMGEPDSDAATNLEAALVALHHLPAGVWVVFSGARGGPAITIQGGYAVKRYAGGACFADVNDNPYGYVHAGVLERMGALRARPVLERSKGKVRIEHVWPGWYYQEERDETVTTVVFVVYACATAPATVQAAVRLLHSTGRRAIVVPSAPLTGEGIYESTVAMRDAGAEVLNLPVELLVSTLMQPPADTR